MISISDQRPLTSNEKELVLYFLEKSSSKSYYDQIPFLTVYKECECGCGSISFAYKSKIPDKSMGINVIHEINYKSKSKDEYGIFLFSINEILAGIEIYSISTGKNLRELPSSKLLNG